MSYLYWLAIQRLFKFSPVLWLSCSRNLNYQPNLSYSNNPIIATITLIALRKVLLIGPKLRELAKYLQITLSLLIRPCFLGKSTPEQSVDLPNISHGSKTSEGPRICTTCPSIKTNCLLSLSLAAITRKQESSTTKKLSKDQLVIIIS